MIRYADNFIEYLINVKKTSGNTVAAYRRDIGKLIHYLENYGVESLEHVSFTILNSYVMGLERMGNATASISRNVSAMKSFFSYLFYEKIIKRFIYPCFLHICMIKYKCNNKMRLFL